MSVIIEYNAEKLNKALQDFYNSTGTDLDLIKPDFISARDREIKNNRYCKKIQASEKGKKACFISDDYLLEKCRKSKRIESHRCHAGLLNVAIPILHDDVILGYLMVGCIKPDADFSAIENYVKSLGVAMDEIHKDYDEIPCYDEDRIQSISNIAVMFVKYILLENMIRDDNDTGVNRAVAYIDENISDSLSIKDITKATNMSKSVLYDKFHKYFNCTVSEYIKKRRIEKSIGFLTRTDMSIEEISQRVGFQSASYYSKTFKRIKGMTPIKYKKGFTK